MVEWIVSAGKIDDFALLKNAGASAVLIGTDFYSARAMSNLSIKDYPKAKQEAKRLGLSLYVLVNRMFVESELEALRSHLMFLKELDVDGIYYGDEGVLYEAMELGIEQKLIYNPDTLLTNSSDVNYYLNEGIQFVSLAKEITLEEIGMIAKHSDPSRVELFIHGRENIMHSKRYLLSSYMEYLGKDLDLHNRHDITIIEAKREEPMPILEDDLGTHVFSAFTLVSFEEINDLIDMGYCRFRIDGIFHDVNWVCEALSCYQDVVNHRVKERDALKKYRSEHIEDHVGSGFYYKKTGLHKG